MLKCGKVWGMWCGGLGRVEQGSRFMGSAGVVREWVGRVERGSASGLAW